MHKDSGGWRDRVEGSGGGIGCHVMSCSGGTYVAIEKMRLQDFFS